MGLRPDQSCPHGWQAGQAWLNGVPFGGAEGCVGGRAVTMQPSRPLATLSESAELGIYFLASPPSLPLSPQPLPRPRILTHTKV